MASRPWGKAKVMLAQDPLRRKMQDFACRCSKIMSPHNCNEILSPCRDGDDESERAATSESDGKCGRREAERTRSLLPAAFERAPGAAAQAPLQARFH